MADYGEIIAAFALMGSKGVPRILHWRPRPKAESGGGGRGQQPLPISQGSLGDRYELPSGVRAEPRPPKGFPLFSALRMASPDTNIVNCGLSCSHGGQDPRAPLAHAHDRKT